MGETAIRFVELERAQAKRREHGRHGDLHRATARALGEPSLHAFEPGAITQAQVLVADALAAGEQRIGELHRLEADVARHRLEPLGRVARGALQLQHLGPAGLLIRLERALQIGRGMQRVGEPDRVLERELGARADREMGRVRRIAQEHDLAVMPALAGDAREVEPRRAAQMRRVAHQAVALEISLEQHLARGDAVHPAHLVETERPPGCLVALDDEGRGVRIEPVGVRPDPAVLGLLEDEGERVEHLVGAEPDVLVPAHLDARLENRGVAAPRPAVDAVGRDDQVGVSTGVRMVDLGFEPQLDAEAPRPLLQDIEQALARDASKAMAARADDLPLEVHVDVVPVLEAACNRRGAVRVVLPQPVQRLVGEHHAPTERVVGAVALDHEDVVRRVAQLHRDRTVQPGRTTADADDLHPAPVAAPCAE